MAYSKVVEVLNAFDPYGVFEIDKHFKPEYIQETFTFNGKEFEIEIPLGLLERVLSGEKMKVNHDKTPNGTTFATEKNILKFIVFNADGGEVLVTFRSPKRYFFLKEEGKPQRPSMECRGYMKGFEVYEELLEVDFAEQKLGEISFKQVLSINYIGNSWEWKDGEKNRILVVHSWPKPPLPSDIVTKEEAEKKSILYHLFRSISGYLV